MRRTRWNQVIESKATPNDSCEVWVKKSIFNLANQYFGSSEVAKKWLMQQTQDWTLEATLRMWVDEKRRIS